MRKWSFLTNHAIVLGEIARQPGGTFRQIASASDVSYRALRKALNDLEKDGYILRKREGREFRYSVNPEIKLPQHTGRDNYFMVHLPRIAEKSSAERPALREYARNKYPNELDEDLITMIEDLIERKRAKKYSGETARWESEPWSCEDSCSLLDEK